jgi:hypothetical protein
LLELTDISCILEGGLSGLGLKRQLLIDGTKDISLSGDWFFEVEYQFNKNHGCAESKRK